MSANSAKGGSSSGVLIFALAVAIGFGAVYLTLPGSDNASTNPARSPASQQAAPDKAHSGKSMVAFVKRAQPESLPNLAFSDGEGKPVSLSDFKGRTVLLNLWATWCAPCREEMPSLNRLQQALGSDKFEVVALSLDRQGVEASKKFLNDVKANALKVYVDPTAKQGLSLKLVGMPTTLLIDREGREIGRLAGPAEWDSEDAKALISAAMQ